MRPDLSLIVQSKRALRNKLATMPIEEKLRMLDALRERTMAIRKAEKPKPPNGMR